MEGDVFERIVREQKDRIYSYAAMMLRDSTEAQDVAQEAMVRLWKHRDRVEPDGAPFWLRRTAHNLCIDRMRRRRTRQEIDAEPNDVVTADKRHGPQRLAESGELGRQIEDALDDLAPRDRAVVILREVQGLPYSEIARLLEVPMGTLKARLHRAREQLRARLVRAGVTP